MSMLRGSFKKLHPAIGKNVLGRIVCRLAARRLLNKALQLRKMYTGCLLKDIRSTKITNRDDFGKGCHSASTEPYFYDSSYQYVKRFSPTPINEAGECVVAKEIEPDTDSTKTRSGEDYSEKDKEKKKWECSSECKPVTDAEVGIILQLKAAFEMPLEDVRHALDHCDEGCPNGHYTRLIGSNPIDLKGHPLVCSNSARCQSKLRVLRAASTHFPVLRKFLRQTHSAITNHKCVFEIDKALCTGNYEKLMNIANIEKFESLLCNEVEASYEHSAGVESVHSALRQPILEEQLLISHAKLIAELEKEIEDYPEHVLL